MSSVRGLGLHSLCRKCADVSNSLNAKVLRRMQLRCRNKAARTSSSNGRQKNRLRDGLNCLENRRFFAKAVARLAGKTVAVSSHVAFPNEHSRWTGGGFGISRPSLVKRVLNGLRREHAFDTTYIRGTQRWCAVSMCMRAIRSTITPRPRESRRPTGADES